MRSPKCSSGMFLRDTGVTELAGEAFSGKAGPGAGQGQLFYPLLGSSADVDCYSAVDKCITHPNTLPIIASVLGGLEIVRFQEFNWRG